MHESGTALAADIGTQCSLKYIGDGGIPAHNVLYIIQFEQTMVLIQYIVYKQYTLKYIGGIPSDSCHVFWYLYLIRTTCGHRFHSYIKFHASVIILIVGTLRCSLHTDSIIPGFTP